MQINSTYNNSDATILITREAENLMSSITPAGVSITIKITNGALSFVLIVPPSWKGLTNGLMGNFNGNKSDEFIPRKQVMPLPDAISDRNLHWMFAQKCKRKKKEENVMCYNDIFYLTNRERITARIFIHLSCRSK